MARGKRPKETQDTQRFGLVSTQQNNGSVVEGQKDDEMVEPNKPKHQEMSQAVGGSHDSSVQMDRPGNSYLEENSSDTDTVVDTKLCRIPRKLYRSLSKHAEGDPDDNHSPETWTSTQKEPNEVVWKKYSDDRYTLSTNEGIRIRDKDMREHQGSDELNNLCGASGETVKIVRETNINGKASPNINYSSHIKSAERGSEIYTCSDVGGAESIISGAKKDETYLASWPFKLKTQPENMAYMYYQSRQDNEQDHQRRIRTRRQSGCDLGINECLHPEKEHDWQRHLADEEKVYLYSAPRTGNIFRRLPNSDLYEDAGTCCHIGNGYVLTCYHCIHQILYSKFGWPHEPFLNEDAIIVFSDPATGGRKFTYKFEPRLYAHSDCNVLDFALLKLESCRELPPHFTTPKLVLEDGEHQVHIFGYQRDADFPFGKPVLDSTSIKLQTPDTDFFTHWSNRLTQRFEDKIVKIYNGMNPWQESDSSCYYPFDCRKSLGDVFLITKLIQGASGGFGVTLNSQGSVTEFEVNFMLRCGYPKFYYDTYINCEQHSLYASTAIQKSFLPCLKFQTGVPMLDIRSKIQETLMENEWKDITFFNP